MMNHVLEPYKSMTQFLGESLGSAFEAVLYDLTDATYPVAASANCGRENQEKLRPLISRAAANKRVRARGYFANLPVETGFGKLLKTSAWFIRDEEGQIIGALCIGVRSDLFMKLAAFATGMIQFDLEGILDEDMPEDLMEDDKTSPAEEVREVVAYEPSLDSITKIIRGFGIEPARMSQDERFEIMCDLYDEGLFELKGAVARTAAELQISAQSVYRYLSKIKQAHYW